MRTTTDRHRALLEEEGLTGSWLATRLGIPATRIEGLRRAGRLLGVRARGSWDYIYPAWQFDSDGKPLPGVTRVVAAARAGGLEDARLYEVLTRRVGLVGDGTLAERLGNGGEDYVISVVRAVAEESSS
jgi:hypothetical protein